MAFIYRVCIACIIGARRPTRLCCRSTSLPASYGVCTIGVFYACRIIAREVIAGIASRYPDLFPIGLYPNSVFTAIEIIRFSCQSRRTRRSRQSCSSCRTGRPGSGPCPYISWRSGCPRRLIFCHRSGTNLIPGRDAPSISFRFNRSPYLRTLYQLLRFFPASRQHLRLRSRHPIRHDDPVLLPLYRLNLPAFSPPVLLPLHRLDLLVFSASVLLPL